jgi:hypothetical protein
LRSAASMSWLCAWPADDRPRELGTSSLKVVREQGPGNGSERRGDRSRVRVDLNQQVGSHPLESSVLW